MNRVQGSQCRRNQPAAIHNASPIRGSQESNRTLYLLDEPLSHLDLNHQMAVLELFSTAARNDGAGVIMVLHDPALAHRFCDRALLVYGVAALCAPLDLAACGHGAGSNRLSACLTVSSSPVRGAIWGLAAVTN